MLPLALFVIGLLTVIATPVFSKDKFVTIEYTDLSKSEKVQIDCLTENIYHEAGFEPKDGKIAVALVTLNRLQEDKFGKDICSVVKQRVKSTCQFSWRCKRRPLEVNQYAYDKAREIALYVYANYEQMRDITNGALYYHADYVHPRWKLVRTVVIGRHIFYKERETT